MKRLEIAMHFQNKNARMRAIQRLGDIDTLDLGKSNMTKLSLSAAQKRDAHLGIRRQTEDGLHELMFLRR